MIENHLLLTAFDEDRNARYMHSLNVFKLFGVKNQFSFMECVEAKSVGKARLVRK